MNPWYYVDPGKDIPMIIEITKGSKVKYFKKSKTKLLKGSK